jgi:hypothetical protein
LKKRINHNASRVETDETWRRQGHGKDEMREEGDLDSDFLQAGAIAESVPLMNDRIQVVAREMIERSVVRRGETDILRFRDDNVPDSGIRLHA